MGKTNGNAVVKGGKQSIMTRQAFTAMLNARRERKYNDNNYTGSLTTAGAVSPWTEVVAQGDTSTTRDGAQIELTSLKLHYSLELSTAGPALARIIVFIDTMNDGVMPAVTDVLTSAVVQSNYTRDVEIVKRYHVLYDQVHSLAIGGSNQGVVKYQNIRCRKVVSYNGVTAATASNGKNSVWTLRIGSVATNIAYSISQGTLYFDS